MECLVEKLKGTIKDNSLPFFNSFIVEVNSAYNNLINLSANEDVSVVVYDENADVIYTKNIIGNGAIQPVGFAGKGKIVLKSKGILKIALTDGSKIDKFEPSCLSSFIELTSFQMGYSSALTGDILESLKNCINLTDLWIPNSSFTGDVKSFAEAQKEKRTASTLTITNNKKLTNDGVIVTNGTITITFDGVGGYTIL